MTYSYCQKSDELLTKPAGVLIKTTLVDFPGLVASSYFMRGCNLRCPYCYNTELIENSFSSNSNLTANFVSAVQVLEHLFKRKNNIQGLTISGGEPLLNPVTPLLIKKAKELGLKIKIDTNGTLPLLLENLIINKETTPDFIAMDIKTSPTRYKKDIPVTQNFQNSNIPELLSNSISILQKFNIKYEIRTVLVPTLVTKIDIEEIAKLLDKSTNWYFAQFRNENCLNKDFNNIVPYTDKQLIELVEYAKQFIPNATLR